MIEFMEERGSASKIRIKIPEHVWIGRLSRQYPYHLFEFESALPIQNDQKICNNIFRISGSSPHQCIHSLEGESDLISHFVLQSSPTELICMIRTKHHEILYLLIEFQLAIMFPISVQNGFSTINIVGSRDQIDQFLSALTARKMEFQMEKIGSFIKKHEIPHLTPRQVDIFNAAKLLGYYEQPRKISLSELAGRLHLSKSTVSVTLQRIHKKLLGERPFSTIE
jgi:predicted DNA binding protein